MSKVPIKWWACSGLTRHMYDAIGNTCVIQSLCSSQVLYWPMDACSNATQSGSKAHVPWHSRGVTDQVVSYEPAFPPDERHAPSRPPCGMDQSNSRAGEASPAGNGAQSPHSAGHFSMPIFWHAAISE